MNIEFEIKGKVKAKQSVKFANIGGFMKKYTPSDVIQYANFVKLSFMNKYPAWEVKNFENKPLKVTIDVCMPVPKSYSSKKRLQAIENEIRPTVKPDCDNIAKNINDSLNGIAYPDDKQIVSLTVNKFYSDYEHVTVKIQDIGV